MSMNISNKPLVRICAWCLKADDPEYKQYDLGVNDIVKKEIRIINQQISDSRDKFTFTHGVCMPHMKIAYADMPDKLPLALKQAESQPGGPTPCLLTDDDTRHAYVRGLFTKELFQQYSKEQEHAKTEFTESLKKLAGIRH